LRSNFSIAKMPGNCKQQTSKENVQELKLLETRSEKKAAKTFEISKTCMNNMKKQKVEFLKLTEHENIKLRIKAEKPPTKISVKLLSISSTKLKY
jgi:hypothetical protein